MSAPVQVRCACTRCGELTLIDDRRAEPAECVPCMLRRLGYHEQTRRAVARRPVDVRRLSRG